MEKAAVKLRIDLTTLKSLLASNGGFFLFKKHEYWSFRAEGLESSSSDKLEVGSSRYCVIHSIYEL